MPHKTVLVIGTSRDIGKAAAIRFAKRGYNAVISCVHRKEQLMQTQKETESFQIPCLAYKGNTGGMVCCEELFLKIKKMFDGVDVLVNNADIFYIGLLQDMAPADWERMLRVNLTSVFDYCKLAVPYMISQRQGKIVNISSVWGVVDASCGTAYSTTKDDINALTKTLTKELAPSNIQVSAVACRAIDIEVNQWMDKNGLTVLVGEIPSGRLGHAEGVTDLTYHLGYKESYLAGQIIGLGGRWT